MLSAVHAADLDPAADTRAPAPAARAGLAGEDAAMIRFGATLARELGRHNRALYWADFLGSAVLGYAALAGTILAGPLAAKLALGLIAVLALYRAVLFIHEISHMKDRDVPGFRHVWNAVAGVPLMVPSFMYEGVHNLHHARNRYGTARDPEYLPLARMKPWTIPAFVAVSALGPIGLLLRYGVLAPLSLLVPPLRRLNVERYSSLTVNPAFRREMPTGAARARFRRLEVATSLWAVTVIALVATGVVPLAAFAIYLAVLSATMVLNQVRTLAAHLWENEGEPMSLTAQYLDSVNVPPPGWLPALWAPVGLRYHALHHLLPGLPYHALGAAHRRLKAAMPAHSAFHGGDRRTLRGVIASLMAGAGRTRAPV